MQLTLNAKLSKDLVNNTIRALPNGIALTTMDKSLPLKKLNFKAIKMQYILQNFQQWKQPKVNIINDRGEINPNFL